MPFNRFVFAISMLLLAVPSFAEEAVTQSQGTPSSGCAKASMKGCGHGKGHGRHGKGHGRAMRHANPMPNLMKMIKRHGAELGLSAEQTAQLADWRAQNMERLHARVAEVAKLEAELTEAALAGRPKAELMGMASRIMTERTQIIATKADCRDNLQRVLTPEQYQQVVTLYQR